MIPNLIGFRRITISERETVVELEFNLDNSEFPLGRVAAASKCDFKVGLIVPKSGGDVLLLVTAGEAPADDILTELRDDSGVHTARLFDSRQDRLLLEVAMDGKIVTTLADEYAFVTQLASNVGGSLIAIDVPHHVDPGAVIDTFVDEFPSARLAARRQTNRMTPMLGQSLFLTEALTQFTERQFQALQMAYEGGYFEWPRDSRAEDIADRIGIATPTFSQHFRAAERKLIELLFEG